MKKLQLLTTFLFSFSYFALAQSVVVNEYQNTGNSSDNIELLVIQDGADLRNLWVKDFSGSNGNDNGGARQFNNITFWSSMKAGTLIVIRIGSTAATDITTSCTDHNLDIGGNNTTYFTIGANTLDIAQNDMVMIKSGTQSGTADNIHTLRGGSTGTQWNNINTGTKIGTTTNVGTNNFCKVNNTNSVIGDFNLGTSGVSVNTTNTLGSGNSTANTDFITFLRGPVSNAATGITSSSFTANWNSLVGATSYRLDVATDANFTTFVTGYNDLNVGNVTTYNVTGLNSSTTYYYRVRGVNGTPTTSGNSCTQSAMTMAPAPIELVYFTGVFLGTSTLLTFSTATEINNAHFSIERSADGVRFEEIGRVPGAGNSSTVLEYSYTDEQPLRGVNYYRLRQEDFDGQFSYSPVVSVVFGGAEARLRIAPSPAQDQVSVRFEEPLSESLTWEVYDQGGRRVLFGTQAAETEQFDFNVGGLAEGFYILRVTSGRETISERFQKK